MSATSATKASASNITDLMRGMDTPVQNPETLPPATAPAATETITISKAKVGAYIATLPLQAIKVGARFRQDQGDLAALAASIQELGLLQPIAVDREQRLIFGHRRLLAHQLLGRDTIQARIIEVPSLLQAEHDENELGKGFTPSERVAIAAAITAQIGNRQGQRTDLKIDQDTVGTALVATVPEVPPGKRTREIAAAQAGFASTTQYRQARKVVAKAEPELRAAMDQGTIAISTAAKLADAEPALQRAAVAHPQAAPHLAHATRKKPPPARVTVPEDKKRVDALASHVTTVLRQLQDKEHWLDPEQRTDLVHTLQAAIARLKKVREDAP